MKTEKYFISFDNIEFDMVASPIEISRTEFYHQLKTLRARVGALGCDGVEFWEHDPRTFESETCIVTTYCFAFGCAVTTLTEKVAKDGYRFLTKKEMARK